MEREESDLYGLPLDEFIPARTELEKRLRKEADRERAAAVKKLPKPSIAAWGVNQASRSQPQARRELLDASAELREVQERLIAGKAAAADLEAATARQRAAIDALVDAASGLLTSDGKALGDAILARVRETFAAVASDEELAELVEAGTVDRERQPAGLGFPFATAASEAPAPVKPRGKGRGKGEASGRGSTRTSAPPRETAKERKQREKEAARREAELEAAREAAKAAKAEEKEAARRRKGAEREAANAEKELERAERAVAKARERAEAAQKDLDTAAAAAEEASAAREAAEAELDRLT